MAKLAWAFNIVSTETLDDSVETAFTDGILLYPKKYPAKFIPRDEHRVTIIESEFKPAELFLRQFQ